MTPHHITLELTDSQQAAYEAVMADLRKRCRKGRGIPESAFAYVWCQHPEMALLYAWKLVPR